MKLKKCIICNKIIPNSRAFTCSSACNKKLRLRMIHERNDKIPYIEIDNFRKNDSGQMDYELENT